MQEPISIGPPAALPIAQLLARPDPAAGVELAALLRGILDAPFFRTVIDARFAIRPIDLHASSPSFPGAVVVADGLSPFARRSRNGTVDIDRETFLATPVLLLDGRQQTVDAILTTALASDSVRGRGWPAIDACVRAIARVVLDAVRAIGPPVDDLSSLLAHHTAPDGASLFVAKEAALNTLGIDAPLDGGLSCAFAFKLVRPRVPQHRVAYEVGDVNPGALLLTVRTATDERLHVLCRAGNGPVLEIATRVDGMFERYVKLVAVLRFAPYARLRVWVDDTLVGSARGAESSIERLVGRQSIGADVLGRHRSALFLRELVLVGSPLGPTARARVSRRLDQHLQE